MSFPTYISGTPKDGSTLGNTKAKIRNNLDGTFNSLAVDHITQNGATPGYHTIIHQVTQTAVTAISGVNQVFSGVPGVLTWTNMAGTFTTPAIPPGGDTQLYSLTGQGGLSQLTGSSTPVMGGVPQPGYAWISGVLLQWGKAGSGAITFPIAFPNYCISVQATSTSNLINVGITSISKTGFTATTSSAVNVYYFAIGN